jgi:hypothetical protein
VRRLAEVRVPGLADVLSADVADIGACRTQIYSQNMSEYANELRATTNVLLTAAAGHLIAAFGLKEARLALLALPAAVPNIKM